MQIPDKLKPFLHQAHWDFLGIERLDDEDRAMILRILEAAFEGENPEEVDAEGVKDVVVEIKALVDDLSVEGDEGPDDEEVPAASEMAEEVLAEMNGTEREVKGDE